MTLFRIERQLPPDATEDDVDAAAFRGIACLAHFRDVQWIRSFFDPGAAHFTCLYEAPSAELIRAHAEMAHLPCDSITEVLEYLPSKYR